MPDWRRSSKCASGECAELAGEHGVILMRDSKNPDGAVLRYTRAEWEAFLAGVKTGEFDNLT